MQLLLILAAAPLLAQNINPQTLLDNLRAKALSTVQRAPRFTCMETIERHWYSNRRPLRPGCDTDRAPDTVARDLVRSDRLRLDVAVGSGQEIFSWHGQKAFQTEEIDKLVTGGPVSSGTYFSFLSSIFLEGIAQIDYRGIKNEAGEQVASFGYSVPLANSKFTTRTDSGKDAMGYHGEFTIAASTGQLRQLKILSDDMPQSARVCAFSLAIDYGTLTINGIAFQLPTNVLLDVLNLNRERTQTFTRYGECHEFRGESVLRFDGDTATTASKPAASIQNLAPGLAVQIKITTSIDPKTIWAGDPIEGTLAASILDADRRLLAPKGAPVNGHILRVETWERPSKFYTVALQFGSLTAAGKEYNLDLKSTPPPPALVDHTLFGQRTYLNNAPISDDPNSCRFRLDSVRNDLKGVVTYWITR